MANLNKSLREQEDQIQVLSRSKAELEAGTAKQSQDISELIEKHKQESTESSLSIEKLKTELSASIEKLKEQKARSLDMEQKLRELEISKKKTIDGDHDFTPFKKPDPPLMMEKPASSTTSLRRESAEQLVSSPPVPPESAITSPSPAGRGPPGVENTAIDLNAPLASEKPGKLKRGVEEIVTQTVPRRSSLPRQGAAKRVKSVTETAESPSINAATRQPSKKLYISLSGVTSQDERAKIIHIINSMPNAEYVECKEGLDPRVTHLVSPKMSKTIKILHARYATVLLTRIFSLSHRWIIQKLDWLYESQKAEEWQDEKKYGFKNMAASPFAGKMYFLSGK